MISRRTFGFGRWAYRINRNAALNGHNRTEKSAISRETAKTKKDVTKTNPAPGPTYAATGSGVAAKTRSPSTPATTQRPRPLRRARDAEKRPPVLFFRP